MKTLIINGSPRVKGDTASLIGRLRGLLDGDIVEVSAYRADISPCIDCRFCRTHSGCAVRDEMETVYDALRGCGSVVIASPIYFSEVTGRVLDVGSRLQTIYCARFFRGEKPDIPSKRGGIILVGGGDGSPDKAVSTSRTLLHQMGCTEIFAPVMSLATEKCPAAEDENAAKMIEELAAFLQHEDN